MRIIYKIKCVFILFILINISGCQSSNLVPETTSSDLKHSIDYTSTSENMPFPAVESDPFSKQATDPTTFIEPKRPTLEQIGVSFSVRDFGADVVSSSYLYWSPKADYIIFIGHDKDESNKYTAGVYILNLLNNEARKIIEGEYDKNYYLNEPQWSADESIVTISFYDIMEKEFPVYLYHLESGELERLLVNGMTPSISPDKNMIVYSGEKGLGIYNISEKTANILPGNIKGFSPIWFSDSRRILFFKALDKNPSGLEGGELNDIGIVDIMDPGYIELLGYEKVYRGCKWIMNDKLVWIRSGWDDGHYAEYLNYDTRTLIELGEDISNYYQSSLGVSFFRFYDSGNCEMLDQNLDSEGLFNLEREENGWYNVFLSLVPDGNLLYLRVNLTELKGMVMLSHMNENSYLQLSEYENYIYPKVTEDGTKIAFLGDNEDSIIIVNSSELAALEN
ncbi:MAG: hypothetical protein FIA99_01175 [Ruminiclostridium sp.]|nr:hypothetical protein [Ruminiclostridium sp.]